MRTTTRLAATDRREFLKVIGIAGAGLTLGFRLPEAAAKQNASTALVPNAFVRIRPDNRIAVIMKHLEMGQGTYTGLATLIAEELDADWSQIEPEGAPADASRYNNLSWGDAQGTGGSSAIANSWEQLRRAGATAKAMLVAAAAERWAVPRDEIAASKGVLTHAASERHATYGELATLAAAQEVPDPETLALKTPDEFVYIGKTVSRKDTGKTDGTAIFTQDVQMSGLLTAVVAHAPRFGSKVMRVDDKRARDARGVVDVVRIPSGVAVLARDFWSAKKGRDLLEIEWDESDAFRQSSSDLLERYRQLAKTPGTVARNDGDVESALAAANGTIEATFEFPFLAHATMEPMNCVVNVHENSCEIWNGDQMQTGDQVAVAAVLGIPMERISINMLYAGGSFGRRANPQSDYVVEAAQIAQTRKGTPVKLVWTREDDMHAGYFRPLYVHRLRGAVDSSGNVAAWDHRIVGQSIMTGSPFAAMITPDGIDPTSVEGASTLPYRIPNLRVDLHTVDLPVPVQWWRSVGSTHTAFSTETFIDELAHAAGRDPVEFRGALLQGQPRHLGVLTLAAGKANWGSALPQGWSRGIAVHESFGTYVAEVAEVSIGNDGNFRVERVVCAVDCGVAVNPDVIRAQMEGGIGYGLSPVLMSKITLDEGRVVQSNFHDYPVLRIDRMPAVEVHIMPSSAHPTGVGEPGTPPVAPAVANALFAATGRPFHTLPLALA